MAKDAGAECISMMTNGRALMYPKYTRGLVGLGMRRFYVSIHGHDKKLHEGLTRTPKSFEQTVAGIREVAKLIPMGVQLHTSTVVTKRNLPHMRDIYLFLRELGVQQVVFNIMQANGRANTFFDQLFPTYTEIAAEAERFVRAQLEHEDPVQAYFVDIPLCTTTALPDHNRGYVEDYVHFEPDDQKHLIAIDELQDRVGGQDGELVQIRRSDLDDNERRKRSECQQCKYEPVCEGVWGNYLRRYGWDEFVPVSP
jgi:cyclic pyranopterin phosphate synthase